MTTTPSDPVKKNDLIQRSVTGALFVSVVVGSILWRTEAALCLFAFFCAVAAWEYLKLSSVIQKSPVSGVSWLWLFLPFAILGGMVLRFWGLSAAYVLLLLPILIFISELLLKPYHGFSGVAYVMGGLFFVSFPFSLVTFFLVYPADPHAMYYLLALLTLVWTNDTFAYLVGRTLGKNKLAPQISPGKTIEGFMGGLIFAAAVGAVWAYCMESSYLWWSCTGLLIGAFATMGDLAESALKRTAGVKDSGTLFPGHGGVLDRFDGFMAAIPVMLFFWLTRLI